MVRSRSETNLNRIFYDLCTSPALRSQHPHQQRQYHPPLPKLKPIKSNSCSNLDDLAKNVMSSPRMITTDDQSDTLTSLSAPKSTAVPLTIMESTGFTFQPLSVTAQKSISLFETLVINHTETSSTEEKSPPRTVVQATPSNSSQDWKQQDFTNRLRNRLKSRGHLRKFFLS